VYDNDDDEEEEEEEEEERDRGGGVRAAAPHHTSHPTKQSRLQLAKDRRKGSNDAPIHPRTAVLTKPPRTRCFSDRLQSNP
jgi:hypothetical protein